MILKKICIISPDSYHLLTKACNSHPIGGAETQLVTLGRELSARNYSVVFFVDNFGQQDKLITDDRIKIIKSPLRYMGGKNYYIFPDWLRLFSNLIREMADVHLLKLPNHLLFPIGTYCRIFRKKLFFICQIDKDVEFPKLKKNKIQYLFYRLGLHFTHCIITQNYTQLNGVKKTCDNQCLLIRNLLSFKETGFFDKKQHILWVGSNLPRKQPKLFINIAKIIPEYHFKMIVSRSKQYQDNDHLSRLCDRLDNIEFIDGIPFTEINKYFQEASLLVSTSIAEGFPNIFLQAWQCGTPVVSLKINPDNVINQYHLGRVSKTKETIVLDIIELMEDKTLRKKIGNKCIEYIHKYHKTNDIINQYCRLFDHEY